MTPSAGGFRFPRVRARRRGSLDPVGDVPEHFLDVVAEAVDEGAAGVEHRERSAEVEARYARLPHRGDAGVPLLPDVDRSPLDGNPAGTIPRGANDPVERLPRPGGELRLPAREGDDRVPLAQGEDAEAEEFLQDAFRGPADVLQLPRPAEVAQRAAGAHRRMRGPGELDAKLRGGVPAADHEHPLPV